MYEEQTIHFLGNVQVIVKKCTVLSPLALRAQVTFELHETFASPRRTIEQQPFEVTEAGWGQFDIGITVRTSENSRVGCACYLVFQYLGEIPIMYFNSRSFVLFIAGRCRNSSVTVSAVIVVNIASICVL
jgi:hypothetical protein